MNALKEKYWSTTNVILHSREIRKCEGPFSILFDLSLKERFYEDLNALITAADFTVIAAAINKEQHIRRYGKLAHDPYDVSLSFTMERLVFCLDDMEYMSGTELVFEKRGHKEDTQLAAHFNAIRDGGTYFVEPDRVRRRITGCAFVAKPKNVAGLQSRSQRGTIESSRHRRAKDLPKRGEGAWSKSVPVKQKVPRAGPSADRGHPDPLTKVYRCS